MIYGQIKAEIFGLLLAKVKVIANNTGNNIEITQTNRIK
jgi:hypothetical protein